MPCDLRSERRMELRKRKGQLRIFRQTVEMQVYVWNLEIYVWVKTFEIISLKLVRKSQRWT